MRCRSRAGRRRRPSAKPQASARGPFVSGSTAIARRCWRDCTIAAPGRIVCIDRRRQAMVEQVEALRRQRCTGKQIAAEVGVSPATVSRILQPAGAQQAERLEPAEPVRRYEREHPGEMIHIDIKKLGRIDRRRPSHHRRSQGAEQPRAAAKGSAGSSSMSASTTLRASPSPRSCRTRRRAAPSPSSKPRSPTTQASASRSSAS